MAHFGIGMWLRSRLLWGESSLSNWFRDNGIFYPDDMSYLILSTINIGNEDRIDAVKRWAERSKIERTKQ